MQAAVEDRPSRVPIDPVARAAEVGRYVAHGLPVGHGILSIRGYVRCGGKEALEAFLEAAAAPPDGPMIREIDPGRNWFSEQSMAEYLAEMAPEEHAAAWAAAVMTGGFPRGLVAGMSWALSLMGAIGLYDDDEVRQMVLLAARTHHPNIPESDVWLRVTNRLRADSLAASRLRADAWRELRRTLPPLLMRRVPYADIHEAARGVALGPLLWSEVADHVDREIYFALRAVRRAARG